MLHACHIPCMCRVIRAAYSAMRDLCSGSLDTGDEFRAAGVCDAATGERKKVGKKDPSPCFQDVHPFLSGPVSCYPSQMKEGPRQSLSLVLKTVFIIGFLFFLTHKCSFP